MGESFKRQRSEYSSMEEEYVNVFTPPNTEDHRQQHSYKTNDICSQKQNNVAEFIPTQAQTLKLQKDTFIDEQKQNGYGDTFNSSQTSSGYGSQESYETPMLQDSDLSMESSMDLIEDTKENSIISQSMDDDHDSEEDSDDVLSAGYTVNAENLLDELTKILRLGKNQRIRYINGIDVDCRSLRVLEVLKSANSNLNIVIEIKEENVASDIQADNDSVDYIEVKFVFGPLQRDSLSQILIHKITTRLQQRVKDISFSAKWNELRIRSYSLTGHFLRDVNGKLSLEPILRQPDTSYSFRVRKFSAMLYVNGRWSSVQLRTFQSMSDGKYISARTFHDVQLKAYPDEFTTDRPDGRFFKLIKSRQGCYFLESLKNPGTYLCWVNHKIVLKIFDRNEMSDANSLSSDPSIYLGS